ncbi:MAG: sodium/proton-translocating pyrophosphatase [Oscillospiraceae bacterium]
MGADLYESYVGSIISASALAVTAGFGAAGLSLPMVMAAIGILASILGTFLVRTGEKAEQKLLLKALRRGTNFSALLIAIVSFPLIWFVGQ